MPDTPSRLAAFLAELRRRRVFRVAAVYACIAFIIFQIVDATFEPLHLPDWSSTLVVVLLVLGFPIAVGMAWAFDLTAEGLVRAKPKREVTAAKAPHHVIIGNKTLAIIAALAVIAAAWSWWGRPSPEAALGAKSIAVLPFVNFSDSKDDEYFSDGITDDILTHLSKIGDLKVIARTSIMQYKNTEKRIRDIGRELGVAMILEGSVRRADSRVRISSQLVDAKTEEHLWAETYDRDLTDIFAIQSDVASQIASALKATLTPDEKSYIEQKSTDNLEAYDYYLKGNAFFYRSPMLWGYDHHESLENAIAMYEKAVELDPDFALAYARLTRAHLRRHYATRSGYDHTAERMAKAKSALDRALDLDADHPEVHLAHGTYHYLGFLDYEAALKQAEQGLKGQPNSSDIIILIGTIKRRQGKWEAALAAMVKAVELDPQDYNKCSVLAHTCLLMRNWAEAERFADRTIFPAPEYYLGYGWKAAVYLRSKGDIERARGVMQEALEKVDPSELAGTRSYIEILSRDYQKALKIVEAVGPGWYLRKANIYRLTGQQEKAVTYYDSVRVYCETRVSTEPDLHMYHSYLGLAYAGLGRREEAIREGKLAVKIMPLSRDALHGHGVILRLAVIYTLLGEQDAAIDQLEILLSVPSYISVPLLKLDPQWDPLREHPRFRALLEKYGGR